MNKYFLIFLSVFSSLLLSSCFEVVEDISIQKNGSGKVTVIANLSRSKSNINSILLLDNFNGYKIPSKKEIENKINTAVISLKKIKGVSNVKKSVDLDNFIFSVSCNFNNVNTLNKVLIHFAPQQEKKSLEKNKQFILTKDKKTFIRNYHYNLKNEIQMIDTESINKISGAYYTTVYHFPSEVKQMTNPDAKLSKNKKAVMLRVDIKSMINNKKNIKNIIKLK